MLPTVHEIVNIQYRKLMCIVKTW